MNVDSYTLDFLYDIWLGDSDYWNDLEDEFGYDDYDFDTYECGCCTCCGCSCYEQEQMDDLDELADSLYNETPTDILEKHLFCKSYWKLVNIYNADYVNDLIFCEVVDGYNM